jgi:hypothetical protein
MTGPETVWQYGVSHVERGEVIETVHCDDLRAAEQEAAECGPDDTGRRCFVVRRPANPEWEPLTAEAGTA